MRQSILIIIVLSLVLSACARQAPGQAGPPGQAPVDQLTAAQQQEVKQVGTYAEQTQQAISAQSVEACAPIADERFRQSCADNVLSTMSRDLAHFGHFAP